MYKTFPSILLICSLVCPVIAANGKARAREIRTGIYQNPPKVFVKPDGTPSGFIIDILNEIAAAEGWDIVYVYGTWEENMRRLARGEIDMMLDVTYTAERSALFDFNSVPVIESWLQVFTLKEKRIETIRDLNGLRLAVLRDSHQHKYFSANARRLYEIDYALAAYPDYQGTIDALRSGSADAIVAGRFFYFSELRGPDIVPTPVIVDPGNILFAFPKGVDRALIAAVDRRLSSLKNDPGSVYYRILQNRLSLDLPSVIPGYIFLVLGILAAALMAVGAAAWFLRMQVAKKTEELHLRNEELEKTKTKLESALAEARSAGDSLRLSLEQKSVLLSELFHRTGNNMQMICSLLTMQADSSPDPDTRRGLSDAVNRVYAMSLVHKQLSDDHSLSRVDLVRYIQELAHYVRDKYGFSEAEVAFTFAMEPLSIPIDYAIPCGLIINELLTNSFRHAFIKKPAGGMISISLALSGDTSVHLVYRDNGVGYPDAGAGMGKDSIGLKLINGIARHQLMGSVEFSSDGGVCFVIRFEVLSARNRV